MKRGLCRGGGDDMVARAQRPMGRDLRARAELVRIDEDDDVADFCRPQRPQDPLLEEAQVEAIGRQERVLEAAAE